MKTWMGKQGRAFIMSLKQEYVHKDVKTELLDQAIATVRLNQEYNQKEASSLSGPQIAVCTRK